MNTNAALNAAAQAARNNSAYLQEYLALAANEAADQTSQGRERARHNALNGILAEENMTPAERIRHSMARFGE